MVPAMPYIALGALVIVVVLGATWLWVSRVRVSPAPVGMMTTRISFPGGLRLHEPDMALARIDHPEEIVIPFEHAILVIDYPLTNPATIEISAPMPEGFTRAALVRTICEEYAHIYDAEEGTAVTKPLPPEERVTKGRNRTDGAYGIWGHDLEELKLMAAHWSRRDDGTVTIQLRVESALPS